MEISFLDIYCPILAALISATIFFEFIYFIIRCWNARKYMKNLGEMEEMLNAQGSNLNQSNLMQLLSRGKHPFPNQGEYPEVPASGTNLDTGQYL